MKITCFARAFIKLSKKLLLRKQIIQLIIFNCGKLTPTHIAQNSGLVKILYFFSIFFSHVDTSSFSARDRELSYEFFMRSRKRRKTFRTCWQIRARDDGRRPPVREYESRRAKTARRVPRPNTAYLRATLSPVLLSSRWIFSSSPRWLLSFKLSRKDRTRSLA